MLNNQLNRFEFIFGVANLVFLVSCQPAEKKITIGYVQNTHITPNFQ